MTLKDQIVLDTACFINPDEFGDEHIIDGVAMMAVLDESEKEQASAGDGGVLFVSRSSLYVRTSELAALPKGLPKPNGTLRVGDTQYMVISVAEEMGITCVSMTLHQS